MELLTASLVCLAVLAGLVGLAFSSEATFGVSVVACGCLLAILARISQAAHQHNTRKS